MTRLAWPKLSETLPYRESGRCQQCAGMDQLQYWQECNEADQPTAVAVVLCRRCSERLIEPHPRLYRAKGSNEPLPGLMEICQDCPQRVELRCCSPEVKFNGGNGIHFRPAPSRVHLNCGRKSSMTGWHWIFGEPPTYCSGKTPAAEPPKE